MPPPIEGPSAHTLTREAAEYIAREIAEAGGVEVFFVGRRGKDGLVEEVESHAFGGRGAVPVLMKAAQPGEVIIHNHPSGLLEPSSADLDVSSALGNAGVGSYIVTNDCSRVRIIVKPHDPRKKVRIDAARVDAFLSPGAELSKMLGGYEDRPQQREMAGAVVEALNQDGIAVIEAGTGVGKSFAYLVPSILFALENKERIVVSTNTINLQEQLLHKDLPLVRDALDREFTAELVKGRSNYVCKRKAQFARKELAGPTQLLLEGDRTNELRELLEWADASETGDLQELPTTPSGEVWERVVSETDNCLRVRCPFYESCFYYNSRRRAARADVLIVNHALLLSDLAVRNETGNWSAAAVLPPAKRIILDEAHHLEECATSHLASRVTRRGLRRTTGRLLRNERGTEKGILVNASTAFGKLAQAGKIPPDSPLNSLLGSEIIPRAMELRPELDLLIEDFGHYVLTVAHQPLPKPRQTARVRLTRGMVGADSWMEEGAGRLRAMAGEIESFLELNRRALSAVNDLDEDAEREVIDVAMEWRSVVGRLETVRRFLGIFGEWSDRDCRWVEVGHDRGGRLAVVLASAPIEVAGLLRELLHNRVDTEILTSATMTVDRRFDFVMDRTGLGGGPVAAGLREPGEGPVAAAQSKPASTLQLDAPFDYSENVFFGVPTDLGDPRQPGFETRLAELVTGAVIQSGGRAFVLFTSYAQMRTVYGLCAPDLRAMGVECLLQGEESRDRLLRRFREDEGSVLFATSSFWEGVDVRGRALELLILAKLPFATPDDPIQQAQEEFLKSKGRDPFSDLVTPRAIIRFRQGFGRLIRSQVDRGVVLVADQRIVRMGYGRRFLRSLPEMDIRQAPARNLVEEVGRFLRAHPDG